MSSSELEKLRQKYLVLQEEMRGLQEQFALASGSQTLAAHDHSITVGGDVKGGIYIGPKPKDQKQAWNAYRRVVASTCYQRSLSGIHVAAGDVTEDQKPLDLHEVYVCLNTTARKPDTTPQEDRPKGMVLRQEAGEPLSALEAVARNPRLVLMGDPGSGKSTFLQHLTLCLAMHGLEPEGHWLERLPGWPETKGNLVPMLITLREFAHGLPASPPKAVAQHLYDFIVKQLSAKKLESLEAEKWLEPAFDKRNILLLLDGLDEISLAAHRSFVRQAVEAFAERFGQTQIVVTCRVLSYQDNRGKLRWRGKELYPAFTLAPFTDKQIDDFITNWYAEQVRKASKILADPKGLGERLHAAIQRPELRRLASNPLLLTVMAVVHTHRQQLPEARALLYGDIVDILMSRWDAVKAGDQDEPPRLQALLERYQRSPVDLRRAMQQLAFEVHQADRSARGEAASDIGELQLQDLFLKWNSDRNWVQELIDLMKLRAGLLVDRGSHVFAFPHPSFQEFLAGAHLSAQPDFPRKAIELFEAGAYWWEAILWAVGKLVYSDTNLILPLALADRLCPTCPDLSQSGWRNAWLAGAVLLEVGLVRVREDASNHQVLEKVRLRLAFLLQRGELAPVEREKVGVLLSQLGDPRKGVGLNSKTGLPDMDWVEVKVAPPPNHGFRMGSEKTIYGVEKPEFTCGLITTSYRIGHYPVTVAQYQKFAEIGYLDTGEKYWTKAGRLWRKDWRVNKAWKPEDKVYQTSNHPQVRVSWYEGVAFCRWLTEQLRAVGEITVDQEVRLPREAEWELAARGTDGREYPWGPEEQDLGNRCNCESSGIGHTSAVGMFPLGESPCGAFDMSGNVWEWCQTKYRDTYKDYEKQVDETVEGESARVLRGGSWADGFPVRLRASGRSVDAPGYRYAYVGFRCVLVGCVSV